MKNIQIIDGAENCTYEIFRITDSVFRIVFPDPKQEIEFIEDLADRLGEERFNELHPELWKCNIDKLKIIGLDGTLFYGLRDKKQFFPKKRWETNS